MSPAARLVLRLAALAGFAAAAVAMAAEAAPEAPPLPERLSETGLYAAGTVAAGGGEPAPGVLAYTPQYPLWSDGAAKRRWLYLAGAYLMKGAFQALKRRMDYAETGGAPLLGIDGVAVICHGGSTPAAIKNAIRVAESYARSDLCGRMAAELARHAPVLESARERLALERGAV